MEYFLGIIDCCDILFFRAMPDGFISAGVGREILHAKQIGIPVLELPTDINGRICSVIETVDFLYESGARERLSP